MQNFNERIHMTFLKEILAISQPLWDEKRLNTGKLCAFMRSFCGCKQIYTKKEV